MPQANSSSSVDDVEVDFAESDPQDDIPEYHSIPKIISELNSLSTKEEDILQQTSKLQAQITLLQQQQSNILQTRQKLLFQLGMLST